MTMDRRTRVDRVLPGLFHELADARTPDYLEAAIARASSHPQRPSWTFPGRWFPMEITTRAVPTAPLPQRQLGVLMIITIVLAATLAVVVGTQQRRLPEPFGPASNGVIALEKDGDIFIADRPGANSVRSWPVARTTHHRCSRPTARDSPSYARLPRV